MSDYSYSIFRKLPLSTKNQVDLEVGRTFRVKVILSKGKVTMSENA